MPGKSVNEQARDIGIAGAPYAAVGRGALETLADLFRYVMPGSAPQDQPPPMVASPEMMQGVPGAQPMANPRAQQPSKAAQIMRYLGLQ